MNAACEFARVSTSAYYGWTAARDQPCQRAVDDDALLELIREVHVDSDGTYGEPRVTAELWSRGHQVNHKRVERLMRAGLQGHRPRRRRSLPKADEKPRRRRTSWGACSNLTSPDQHDLTWCGDIMFVMFVRTDEG